MPHRAFYSKGGEAEDDGSSSQEESVMPAQLIGSFAASRVPAPVGLWMCSRPPSASTLSAKPRKPDPRAGSAPPTPSSSTIAVI